LKKNKNRSVTLIFLIVLGIFFSVYIINFKDESQDRYFTISEQENFHNFPTTAGPALPYSALNQNATTVYRLFESINFTIDTSNFNASYTIMQISFRNGSLRNYNMVEVGNNKSFYEYKPRYNAPLGVQNVSFQVYHENNTLLNAQTTTTNFTIDSNYGLWYTEYLDFDIFHDSDYYIGDFLSAGLTIDDFGPYQFWWNITIVNSTIELYQKNLFNLEKNIVQFTFQIENESFSQVNKIYYIKLNISDRISGKLATVYIPFNVLNSNPMILASTVKFSPAVILRTENCEITLNATDVENNSTDLSVNLLLEDPFGVNLPPISLVYRGNNNFSQIFSIPAESPIGMYRAEITVEDQNNGFNSSSTFLTVENNFPEIHSYTVNGISMNQSISILYGKDIEFSFNVSDVEEVAYIKVALLNGNNEWYNFTTSFKGESTKITIRTIELISGVWYAYIYVIDSDGAITSLIDDYGHAPQGITIISDSLRPYLTWITFFIGIVLGILAGVGIVYKKFKSKYGKIQAPSAKTSAKKKTSTSRKPLIKKKEELTKVISEERELEETKTEPKDAKKEVSKRKIKRKL